MLESNFREVVRDRVLERLPDALIFKNDPNYLQGVPDLTILYHSRYAILELKRSAKERKQPNQEYYIDLFREWSFGAFIYPENIDEVIDDLERALTA